MKSYDGCRLKLGIPTEYPRVEELTRYFQTKMPGIGVETFTTDKTGPEVVNVDAPQSSAEPLLLVARGWLDEFLLPAPLQW
jgi:hypothetical protein